MANIFGPALTLRAAIVASISTVLLTGTIPAAAQVFVEVGYTALMNRLGAGNFPTGANVVVAQVEASESVGNYGPNQSNGEFLGKSFTAQSGPPGNSGHATLVGQNFYGTTTSIAPGISSIFLYEVNNWLTAGYLRYTGGGAVQPLATPGGIKIINNSWIGTAGVSGDTDILRRADYAANRDEVLMIEGMPNSATTTDALLWHSYNGVAVGLSGGTSFSTLTFAGYDGPGRMKPDIVAPGQLTSFATPIVSAACADLVQTARTVPALMSNPSSQRSEVLKAALLCGGFKNPIWTNNPSTSGPNRGVTATPLDPVFGVGTVNIDNSHLVLTGLEQNGSLSIPSTSNVSNRGWDYSSSLGMVANRYYRFHVSSVASKVYAVATWNRYVEPNMSFFLMPNFDLQLWKVNASNQLVSLVGNGGVGVFAGGNVVSQSAVDNIEHIYVTGLQPGDYVLQLSRNDNVNLIWDAAVAWRFPKAGDVNGDSVVGIDDLVAVITAWGACPNPSNCPADVNGSGSVNIDDLVLVITSWG